jgi:hypothetical protein
MRRRGTAWLPHILVLCLLAGCTKPMISAFGSNSEIVIITAARCRDEAEILKTILEREVLTVQYEKAFEVRVASTADIRPERNRKNIILIDFLEPSGELSDTILRLAGRGKEAFREGRVNRKLLEDRWAKGQALILVAAPSKESLRSVLIEQSEDLFGFIEKAVQGRLDRALFHAGEQEAASERLGEEYGWHLRLPTGYEVDETYASQRVIKIVKDQPARMITVYWEGGRWADLGQTCLERKKMLAWEFWDEDEVVEGSVTMEEAQFVGQKSMLLRGTWENTKYTIGGCFETYCFGCDECGRNYVVDAAVFAPGLEKLPLVRELRAILVSFSCLH